MPGRSRPTFTKRAKERARAEKQQEKAQRKQQRKLEKQNPMAVDDDIAGGDPFGTDELLGEGPGAENPDEFPTA